MSSSATEPPQSLSRSDLRRRPLAELPRLLDSVLDRGERVRTEPPKTKPILVRLLGRWIPQQ